MKMMKTLILLVLFLSTVPLLGQNTDNEKRITELPLLIEQAAAKEDYILASKLQYELEYRQNLKQAVDEKNYSGAAHWQNELDLLLGIKKEIPGKRPRYNERYATNKLFLNLDISYLAYSHINYIGTNYYVWPATTGNLSLSGPSLGIKFGGKYFFNNYKKSRLGIDLAIISIQGIGVGNSNLGSGVVFSPVRPGLIYTYFFNPKSGLDLQINSGAAIFNIFTGYETHSYVGIIASSHLRYWIGHLGLGVEYNYGNMLYGRGDYNNLALTFGFRF